MPFFKWGPLATNVHGVHRDEMKLRNKDVHDVLVLCKKKMLDMFFIHSVKKIILLDFKKSLFSAK